MHTHVRTYTHTDTYITEIVKMQGTCALQSIEIYAVMCTGIPVYAFAVSIEPPNM